MLSMNKQHQEWVSVMLQTKQFNSSKRRDK